MFLEKVVGGVWLMTGRPFKVLADITYTSLICDFNIIIKGNSLGGFGELRIWFWSVWVCLSL